MSVDAQVKGYIAAQPEPKRGDLQTLHHAILGVMPKCKLRFLDGKNASGKAVANPNIGYGTQLLTYANGKSREFYQVGISANTTGISVYILGLDDKTYLARTYGKGLGKAKVTGYCIRFRALADTNLDTLMVAIRDGVELTSS